MLVCELFQFLFQSYHLDKLDLLEQISNLFSPVTIIHMIHDMSHELEEMKLATQTLIKEQEDIKKKLVQYMPEVYKKLQSLENQTGPNKHYTSSALKDRFDNLNI